MVVGIDKSSDPDGIWATGVVDKDKSVSDRVDQFTADSDRYNDSAFSTDKRTDWTSGLGPGQKAGEGQTSVSDQLSRRRGTSRGTYSFGRGPTGTTGQVGRTSASAFRGNPYTAYSKRPVVRAEERETGVGPREERKRDEATIVRPATRDLGDAPRATRTEFLRPDEVGTSRDTEAMTRKYGENFQETEGYQSEVKAFDYSPEPEVFLASATGRFGAVTDGQNRDQSQIANLSNLNRNKQQLYETMDQTGVGEVTDQDWINRGRPGVEEDPSAGGTKYFKKGFLPGTGTWEDKEQRTIKFGYDDPTSGETRRTLTEGEYLQEYGYGQYGDATYDRELKESYRRNWEQQNPGKDFDAENLMSQNYTPPKKEFNPRTGPPPVPTEHQKIAYASPDTEDIPYKYTGDTGGYYNEFGEFIPNLKVESGEQIASASSTDAYWDKLIKAIEAQTPGKSEKDVSDPYPGTGRGRGMGDRGDALSDGDTLVASAGDLDQRFADYERKLREAHERAAQLNPENVQAGGPLWVDRNNARREWEAAGGPKWGQPWRISDAEQSAYDKAKAASESDDLPSMDQLQSGEGYIKNEETGEVFKVGEGVDTSSTTDLNKIREAETEFGIPSSDSAIAASDKEVAEAEAAWTTASNNQKNYLGGRTAGTQEEFDEYMKLQALSDAASKRLDAAYARQAEAMKNNSSA